jgi:N6-adenosine-specific RNA methylase IME4
MTVHELRKDTVAQAIGHEFNKVRDNMLGAMQHYIMCGCMLIDAKATAAHGEWLPWLRANESVLGFDPRNAQKMMALAKKYAVTGKAASTPHLAEADLIRISRALWGNEPARAIEYQHWQAPQLPPGQYSVLYADPPWQYEYSPTDSRRIENQYPTMTVDEICMLSVPAAPEAILFLWATSPKLSEALRVVAAWGFVYRTCAVWAKPQLGMGYYFRQQHELLLVAVKGSPPAPIPQDRPGSVYTESRTAHSKKPDWFRSTITTMYPDVKKIELFARTASEGWDCWGNEIDNP